MVLLATQVPLLDTNSLTFTFIDAVGVEKYTGKSFLLDFKTGYDVGWTRGQHAMNIITTVRDSPKNQHMLQIGWELAIAEAAHAMSFDTAYIMLANRKQACCKRVPISSWAKTHRHCIVNGIVNKKGKH